MASPTSAHPAVELDSAPLLHPDRGLPADTAVRPIARQIYASTADLPIVSMHGHVEVEMLRRNERFSDPAQVLVIPDHYLVRMLVSQGATFESLGIGPADDPRVEKDPRQVFRTFAAGWHHFRGTPTRFWMEHVLSNVFGIRERLSPATADDAFDQIAGRLASDEFRPLSLLDRFRIDLIATTDPATSDLSSHRDLHERGWASRIVPTFRPDALIDIEAEGWPAHIRELARVSGVEIVDYRSFIAAIEERRAAFVAAGATACDHGTNFAETHELPIEAVSRLFDNALRGEREPEAAAAFAGHMLNEMARMSSEDGLVMQLHPGVVRNHDRSVLARYGADVGYDIPVAVEFTLSLRPLLERWGHHPKFRLILFTMDEDVYSRELAPLAGVYPSVRLGAPWWFLDAPDAMRRVREAVVETAGFSNLTGFVDDTRAFFSIPARHDLARRVDAGHLARLVAEHRLDLDEALEVAFDLASRLPRAAYATA